MVVGFLLVAVLQQQPPAASGVRMEVSPAQAELQVGQTLQMSARVLDAKGAVVPGARIIWFGGGDGSVDSTGVVRGGFRGYVNVVAMAVVPGSGRVSEQVRVRVTPAPAAKLDLAVTSLKLAVGSRYSLTGTPKSVNDDIRYDPITYASSAPTVVSVTPDGRLQALRAGSATITGAAGSATARVTVDVVAATPASVTLSPATTSVRTGDVVRYTATVKDRAGRVIEGLTPRWSVAAVGLTAASRSGAGCRSRNGGPRSGPTRTGSVSTTAPSQIGSTRST